MNGLISIVVGAERADQLIWQTLRSVAQSQLYAARHDLASELIVCVGEGDSLAQAALGQWQRDHLADRLLTVKGATDGQLRRAGWRQARGEAVIWVAGDELISENFIYLTWLAARNHSSKAVVHPEFVVSLVGGTRALYNQQLEIDLRLLLRRDPWPGAGLFSRELLATFLTDEGETEPTATAGWWLNAASAQVGGTHIIAPGTTVWRRQPLEGDWPARCPKTNPLYDDPRVFFYPTASDLNELGESRPEKLPEPPPDWPHHWLDEERWRLAAGADVGLYLHSGQADLWAWSPQPRQTGRLEARWSWLRQEWTPDQHYSHVFILPRLTAGGAEKETIALIQALADHFGRRSLVILTEPGEPTWADRLPATTGLLQLQEFTDGLTDEERGWALLRLLLQRRPGVIHVVGSDLGWRLLTEHGAELSQASRLFATCFADWFGKDGIPQGQAMRYLAAARPHLSGVMTDSQFYRRVLQDRFGLADDFCHWLPAPIAPIPTTWTEAEIAAGRASKQILWAGRLDRSKRVDLLAQVAARLPEYTFWVWGEPIMNDAPEDVAALRQLDNVVMMGGYADFAAVLERPYALFMYTSSVDGMPNVLLEAVAAGLPVVAPDIGGIKELINDETGYLVPQYFDVEQYIMAIRQATGLTEQTAHRAERASALIATRHSPAAFVAGIERIPGYLRPT